MKTSPRHPSLRDAAPTPYWLADTARPDAAPALTDTLSADLVVVGGGYLGLWTALLAVTREPGRDVVVIEAETCGHAASGRNGGFCEASLTHGLGNGLRRWPEELATLVRLGRQNLDEIERAVAEHAIDCDFVRAGALSVATLPEQVEDLAQEVEEAATYGSELMLLDAAAVRARVDSPTYLGALHDPDSAILEPARLAWGLRAACERAGVRIFENSRVLAMDSGTKPWVRTGRGRVTAKHLILAGNAYLGGLAPALDRKIMPVATYNSGTSPATYAANIVQTEYDPNTPDDANGYLPDVPLEVQPPGCPNVSTINVTMLADDAPSASLTPLAAGPLTIVEHRESDGSFTSHPYADKGAVTVGTCGIQTNQGTATASYTCTAMLEAGTSYDLRIERGLSSWALGYNDTRNGRSSVHLVFNNYTPLGQPPAGAGQCAVAHS